MIALLHIRRPHSRSLALGLLAAAALLAAAGCKAPGKPGPDPEVPRPSQVLDFPTLYAQNCASCHGVHGLYGAAISLANPVYLAVAGPANVQRITADGVPGTAMPPFAQSKGGMLTDRQIVALTSGMTQNWGSPNALAGQPAPAYASTTPGNPAHGQQAFAAYCAQCHGADATGGHAANNVVTGSIVDPSYLALITDQGLRSILIAGQPEQGMPNWHTHAANSAPHTLTDAEITDIVAWLASHRTATPGQVYRQHP